MNRKKKVGRGKFTIDDIVENLSRPIFDALIDDNVDGSVRELFRAYGAGVIRTVSQGDVLDRCLINNGMAGHHYELGRLSVFMRGWSSLTLNQQKKLKRRYNIHKIQADSIGLKKCALSVRALEINRARKCGGKGNFCYLFDKEGNYLGIVKHRNNMSYTWAK